MSKMIVEKSFGGTIDVQNSGGGAKFSIRLPMEP
jgi:signal transduction histidine kinase